MANNILVVHEFDTIIGNPDYKESKKIYKYLGEPYFKELIQYAKEYFSSEAVDATPFMKIGFRKGVKDTISLRNYVGLIELPSGFKIEILPKIALANNEKDEDTATKKVFLKMLQCLKDFQGKAFENASLKADRMNLYEIIINMYILEVQTLVKHGIKSSYNMVEDNLTFFKGKLLVNQNIKANLAHKERFYMAYDEYSVNRPENRLIKSTLLKLMKKSSNFENIKEIKRLLTYFDAIDESTNYDKDLSCVIIDRNMKDYETLMIWSKVFLYNNSFTTFSGNTKGKSILFPMEKVFEQYVAKWVRKVFGDNGWEVRTQDRKYYLFNEPQKRFLLKPDIVIKRDNTTVIMDTKWKNLNLDEQHNYGISQLDMYQMYAYSKKYMQTQEQPPEVWLIYPSNDNSSQIKNRHYSSDDGVNVHIYFVNVSEIETSINDLLKAIKKNEIK